MSLILVFGGCCANALTLQQLTTSSHGSGSLITFCQFAFISLVSLFFNIDLSFFPAFKPRRIPILPYLIQVVLFYATSLLNNAVFAYRIPVNVHIIFRSGGLVTNMILDRLIAKKSYSWSRIGAVILVTLGIFLTTISASASRQDKTLPHSRRTYFKGISILAVALTLSSYLGLVQEWTIAAHESSNVLDNSYAPAYLESLFYLHALALPMFIPLFPDIRAQFTALGSQPHITIHPKLTIPTNYIYLTLNTITQLICATGVHLLLSSSYTSLTITLILVVRKAVSLLLSVLMNGHWEQPMMWTGALLVISGTIVYAYQGQ